MNELGLDGDPFQCCLCQGPVGVIVMVRRAIDCKGSNYHGSWLEEKADTGPHICCDACEAREVRQVLQGLLANSEQLEKFRADYDGLGDSDG